jgi:hypothetical protein
MAHKLDGTDKITPTPYDAHEQVVRKPHTHSREEGYKVIENHEPVLDPAPEAVDEADEPEAKKKGKKGKD